MQEKTKEVLVAERQAFAEQEVARALAFIPQSVVDLQMFGIVLRAAAAALEQYRIASWGMPEHEARARELLVSLAQHSSDMKDQVLNNFEG